MEMCKNAWKKLEICEKIFLGKVGFRTKVTWKKCETTPVWVICSGRERFMEGRGLVELY